MYVVAILGKVTNTLPGHLRDTCAHSVRGFFAVGQFAVMLVLVRLG